MITQVTIDLPDTISEQIEESGISQRQYRDPFDRLLIAQSLSEKLPILSRDATFDHYAVQRIWT